VSSKKKDPHAHESIRDTLPPRRRKFESTHTDLSLPEPYGTEQPGPGLDIFGQLIPTTLRTVDSGSLIPSTVDVPKKTGRKGYSKSLICTYVGCTYEGTFPRQWELQRHIATQHANRKPYRCPVVGCFKHGGVPAFARPDKLTDHIRAAHQGKGASAVCPAPACTDTPLRLDLLSVHINLGHLEMEEKGEVGKVFRALANAGSTDYRRCPLLSCKKKRVRIEEFLTHLFAHEIEDVEAASSELEREGYSVGRAGCEYGEGHTGAVDGWCVCRLASVEVACPVCASRHWDIQSLKDHVGEAHVQVGEDLTAFRWRILALVGMEATQILGREAWSDIASLLRSEI
jgi:hypothetical protein